MGENARPNVIFRFRTTGIYPFNSHEVLKKFLSTGSCSKPSSSSASTSASDSSISSNISIFENHLIEVLQKERFANKTPSTKGQRKKVNVLPGKSVLGIHFGDKDPQKSNEEGDDDDDKMEVDNPSSSFQLAVASSPRAENINEEFDPEYEPAHIELTQPEESEPVNGKNDETELKLEEGSFVIVSLSYIVGIRKKTCM